MKEKQNKQCADDDSKKTACKNKNNRKRYIWSLPDGLNWTNLLCRQPGLEKSLIGIYLMVMIVQIY